MKIKYKYSRQKSIKFLNKLLISNHYPNWKISEDNVRKYKKFLLSKQEKISNGVFTKETKQNILNAVKSIKKSNET